MITNITAQNLKGRSFNHELAPVTMFVGDNFSGKTSRIDAIYLALLGWLPGISKKPGDLHADLASGSSLLVSAELAGHGVVCREWLEQRGSVKYIGTGDDIEIPPVALVTQEFLGLSPAERVKFIFARAKLPPELSAESVRQSVCANVKNIKLDENTIHSEKAIADLVTYVLGRQSATAQDFIANLTVDVNEKKKIAASNVQRMTKTQQGMVIIAPDAQACSAAEIQLKEAQEHYAKWREELAKTEADGRRLSAELSATKAEAALLLPDEAEARKELDRLSREKEKVAKACFNPPSTKAAEREWQAISQEQNAAAAAEAVAEQEFRKAEKDRNALKADTKPCCPTCGQSLKNKIAVLLEAAEKQFADTFKKLSHAREVRIKLENKLKSCAKQLNAVRKEVETFNANQQKFRQLSADHAAIQSKVEGNAEAAAAAKRIPELEAKLNAARENYKGQAVTVEQAKQSVAKLEDAYKELVAQQSRCQQQQAAADELEKQKAELEVLKAAVSMLNELQAKLVTAAVAPLIDTANQLCGGLLVAPLAYKDGDVGFAENGRFYSHRSFSGTEKALAYAAISVALATDTPLKLVVIDELGRLDSDNKVKLLKRLCDLTKKKVINQAILVDVEAPEFRDGIEIIAL